MKKTFCNECDGEITRKTAIPFFAYMGSNNNNLNKLMEILREGMPRDFDICRNCIGDLFSKLAVRDKTEPPTQVER